MLNRLATKGRQLVFSKRVWWRIMDMCLIFNQNSNWNRLVESEKLEREEP